MREQATVYVVRQKRTGLYWNADAGDFGSLAESKQYRERQSGTRLAADEECVPCRLTVLSSRTKRSKRRTR